MKRLLIGLVFLVGLTGLTYAGDFDYDVPVIKYNISVAANVSTTTLIIKRSSNTWPAQDGDREVHLYNVRAYVDKAAASTCTVKLGVVTNTSSTTGHVAYFMDIVNTLNVSNTNNLGWMESKALYNLRVDPVVTVSSSAIGSTPYLLTNDKSGAVDYAQNDLQIVTILGIHEEPAPGDVVLRIVNGTGAIAVYLEVQYDVED